MTALSAAQEQIIGATRELGEGWAYPHACRVLKLSEHIAGALAYHADWFWYAAFLHDWGAFNTYKQKGVDHALRSAQIARDEILPGCGLPAEAVAVIIEAIERHDLRDPRPVSSPEALLLREADFLDFLGPLGLAREFAWGPNDLKKAIERARMRIANIEGRFTLPIAQEMGARRITAMRDWLAQIEADSFGYF